MKSDEKQRRPKQYKDKYFLYSFMTLCQHERIEFFFLFSAQHGNLLATDKYCNGHTPIGADLLFNDQLAFAECVLGNVGHGGKDGATACLHCTVQIILHHTTGTKNISKER